MTYHWQYSQWEAKPKDHLYLQFLEWKDIPNYPGYRLVPDGRVYSDKIKDIRKPNTSGKYYMIQVCHESKTKSITLHRLVVQLYGDAPTDIRKTQVNHIDGDKANNHIDNLDWLTPSENTQHAMDTGLNKCKKAIIQYDLEGNEIARYCSTANAGRKLGIGRDNITQVCRNDKKTAGKFVWRYETDPLGKSVTIVIHNIKRRVAKLDSDEAIIEIYDSIRDANLACGRNTYGGPISLVCSGKQEKAYGYKWKILEE